MIILQYFLNGQHFLWVKCEVANKLGSIEILQFWNCDRIRRSQHIKEFLRVKVRRLVIFVCKVRIYNVGYWFLNFLEFLTKVEYTCLVKVKFFDSLLLLLPNYLHKLLKLLFNLVFGANIEYLLYDNLIKFSNQILFH